MDRPNHTECIRERDDALKRAQQAEEALAALGPIVERLKVIADVAQARADQQAAVIDRLRRLLAEADAPLAPPPGPPAARAEACE